MPPASKSDQDCTKIAQEDISKASTHIQDLAHVIRIHTLLVAQLHIQSSEGAREAEAIQQRQRDEWKPKIRDHLAAEIAEFDVVIGVLREELEALKRPDLVGQAMERVDVERILEERVQRREEAVRLGIELEGGH